MNPRWYRLLCRKLRLSRALLVAAWFSVKTPRAAAGRVRSALATWFRFARDPEGTEFWSYFRHLRTCYKCPLFYKPLRTCGSPLDKKLDGLGCWCYMPEKAAMAQASCWLDIHAPGNTTGWIDRDARRDAARAAVKRARNPGGGNAGIPDSASGPETGRIGEKILGSNGAPEVRKTCGICASKRRSRGNP